MANEKQRGTVFIGAWWLFTGIECQTRCGKIKTFTMSNHLEKTDIPAYRVVCEYPAVAGQINCPSHDGYMEGCSRTWVPKATRTFGSRPKYLLSVYENAMNEETNIPGLVVGYDTIPEDWSYGNLTLEPIEMSKWRTASSLEACWITGQHEAWRLMRSIQRACWPEMGPAAHVIPWISFGKGRRPGPATTTGASCG